MKRILITPCLADYPDRYHKLLCCGAVYDSSCSPEARVVFVDKDVGYFLKSAPLGSLEKEAKMNTYFHSLGLGPAVADYFSDSRDWLLTERVAGEDLTHADYLSRPKFLCDTLAETLYTLHTTPHDDCPIKNRTCDYLSSVEEGYKRGAFDTSLFPDGVIFTNPEDAISYVRKNCSSLEANVLLHGDYCLPNVIMNRDKLSGFIDLGGGGIGDRHIDLFWGAWTLRYNLGTDKYRERFFDAYGRGLVDVDRLRLISIAEMFG